MDEQGNKQDVTYRLYEKRTQTPKDCLKVPSYASKVNTLSSQTEIGHNIDQWQESYIRSLMLK